MSKLIDFQQKRRETIEKKRRSFERLLFQNFLGAYTVLDQGDNIYPVTLVDISHEGCLFQVPWNVKSDKKFAEGTPITLRMYFSRESYIPVLTHVRYGKEHVGADGEVYMHYGAEFDKSTASFEAMGSFIDFLYKFAELSVADRGDHKVYFL